MSLNGRRSGSWVGATGILVALVMMATASFAGAQSATPGPAEKTTFIYGTPGSNSSLNPLVGYLGIDYTIWSLEYNLPIEFATKDFGADLEHSIVTSVDTSSDNMSFTYHMRSPNRPTVVAAFEACLATETGPRDQA